MSHRPQPGALAGAQHVTAAVHDGRAQVTGHPAVVVQGRPVPVRAQERLLHDVLGARLVTNQQQGQPDEPDHVPPVQIADGLRGRQILRPCGRLRDAGGHIYKTPPAAV
jgi:hypothetical protein